MSTLKITAPIYRKDYMPRVRKNDLLGLNWYTNSSNTFNKKGVTTTGVAIVKKAVHEYIERNKQVILTSCPDWDPNHKNGFNISYKVYAKRLGSDGHNIRSAMEKMILDALEESGLIDNDKYVYKTQSEFYLQRTNPRIEIEISHLDDYNYIID